MNKTINGSITRGYMRRGLLTVAISETAEDIERRINYDDLRILFVVPWKIVENKELWKPSKEDFMEAAKILNHIRKDKAARIRKERTTARS